MTKALLLGGIIIAAIAGITWLNIECEREIDDRKDWDSYNSGITDEGYQELKKKYKDS